MYCKQSNKPHFSSRGFPIKYYVLYYQPKAYMYNLIGSFQFQFHLFDRSNNVFRTFFMKYFLFLNV